MFSFDLPRKFTTQQAEPTELETQMKAKEPFKYEIRKLQVGGTVIEVEVADSDAERTLGLSHRIFLDQNKGMLFEMGSTQIQNFWMNDMLLPLDVIWIRGGKVIGMSENVQPPTNTNGEIARMSSEEPADQVLEVNAGFVKQHNVERGQEVREVK